MRKSMAGPLGLIAACIAFSTPAAELSEVVVTANRVPEPLDAALSATTVITREEIERRQARSVDDLLQGVAGLAIGNSGGPGKLTSFFVRGADADHLLVLIDGVRIGSATAGTAALQNIPVEMIERIEFVRGPRSSLYGSEAIGGVLQIFTRRPTDGELRPEFAFTLGGQASQQGYASLAGGEEQAWFQVQASAHKTRGFDACRGSSTLFVGCFTEETDRDGYRYASASLRAGWKGASGTAVEGNLLRANSRVEFDGSFTNRSRILQQVLGIALEQDLGVRGRVNLKVGRAWDRSRDFLQSAAMGRFETRRDNANAQWDVALSDNQLLTLGAEHQHDQVLSDTAYLRTSRDNTALFAQYVANTGAWRTELSLRGDDNQQFGSHGTGSVAVGYSWSPHLQLLAQAGTGFKAPSFNDLYYPFFGNAELKPERSRSLELALRGNIDGARWRVSWFDTRFRDMIGLDPSFLPSNIDRARVRGLESTAGFTWQEVRVESGLTLLDARDRSASPNRDNRLARRPRVSGHLDLERSQGSTTYGVRWVAEGERQDNAANTRSVAGYGTLDLRAETRLANHWRIQARIANVLDRRYETVAFYNQSGRTAFLTLRYAAK